MAKGEEELIAAVDVFLLLQPQNATVNSIEIVNIVTHVLRTGIAFAAVAEL